MAVFIVLHGPDGSEVFVNKNEIILVGTPDLNSYRLTGAKAAVLVHDTWIAVRETPREVIEAIGE